MLLPGHKSCVINFVGSDSDPRKLLFDEGGSRIFAGCNRGEIEIYDLRMQRLYKSIVGHYHNHITSLVMHEDILITAGSDGVVKAWDTSSGLDIRNSFSFSIDKIKQHKIDKQMVWIELIIESFISCSKYESDWWFFIYLWRGWMHPQNKL